MRLEAILAAIGGAFAALMLLLQRARRSGAEQERAAAEKRIVDKAMKAHRRIDRADHGADLDDNARRKLLDDFANGKR